MRTGEEAEAELGHSCEREVAYEEASVFFDISVFWITISVSLSPRKANQRRPRKVRPFSSGWSWCVRNGSTTANGEDWLSFESN